MDGLQSCKAGAGRRDAASAAAVRHLRFLTAVVLAGEKDGPDGEADGRSGE